MPDKIRILIADDHAVVRKGLTMILNLEPDMEVVGEAQDGDQAVEMGLVLEPDLLLLDRMMPGKTGREVVQALKKDRPGLKILLLTGTEVDESALGIVQAGVDGYTLKDIEPDDLKQAIRTVAAGEPYLHPHVSKVMIKALDSGVEGPEGVALTPREEEVLRWMAGTTTYRQIAGELNISEETVRTHAKSILQKLDQPNRAQAVIRAMQLGLIELSQKGH